MTAKCCFETAHNRLYHCVLHHRPNLSQDRAVRHNQPAFKSFFIGKEPVRDKFHAAYKLLASKALNQGVFQDV